METRINTENEAKLITDHAGLVNAEQWLVSRLTHDTGCTEYYRNHYYFDLPSFALARCNSSFRKSVGRYSYCLKYPVKVEAALVTRREVFLKTRGFPIDMMDPIHRRFPIMTRLLSALAVQDPQAIETMYSFQPRVRLEIARRYRRVFYPDGRDIMVFVMFDLIKAFSIGHYGQFYSWAEVELETNGWYPERIDSLHDIAGCLAAEFGMTVSTTSKYSHSLSFMNKILNSGL